MDNTNVLLALPNMNDFEDLAVKCLMGIEHSGEIAFLGGSLIDEARENIADGALAREDITHIMWIDSDMVFQADIIKRLLDLKADVATGLYFKRVKPYTPTIFKFADKGIECITNYGDKPFEVDACGFGGCLTSVECLRAVKEKFGTMFTKINKAGEDVSFCARARDMGYKVICDPRIKMGHITNTIITEDTYKAFNKC